MNSEINSLNTKLLISCPSDHNTTGGLFILDLKNNFCKKIFEGDCRGMVYSNKYYYVATETHGLLQINNALKVLKTYKLPKRDIHGLRKYKKNFFITETSNDLVGIYKLENTLKKIDEIKPHKYDSDQSHMNDILIDNNKLYISMFSVSGKWKEKEESFDGAILEYDLTKRQITKTIKNNLQLPHSLLKHGNDIFFCESLGLNLSNQNKVIAKFGGYTRGLCFDGRYFYIGQSEMRHLDRILSKLSNVSIDCGIHVYDTKKRINRFVHIPSKQIYEIISINEYKFRYDKKIYFSSINSTKNLKDTKEWHDFENEYRWMSNKTVTIYLTKSEKANNLNLKIISQHPQKYTGRIYINSLLEKTTTFNKPGETNIDININHVKLSPIEVTIRVDKLWKPNKYYKTGDSRSLGLAIREISIN